VLLSDLDSTNGTLLGAVGVRQVILGEGPVELRLADTVLRIAPLGEEEEIPLERGDRFGSVLGKSAAMRELFHKLARASAQDVTILLEGETGTGKELLAREIHQHSPRRDRPFVIIDCGAIPATLIESELFGHARGAFTGAAGERAGAFEEAHRGTIFLDEIGELDLGMQPRLLRALESGQVKRLGEAAHRKVDVRIIAATHRDLERAVNHAIFRADLFYRLAVVRLRVPPLRERPEDIEPLAQHLLAEASRRFGLDGPPPLSPAALQQIVTHRWPGNVRELRNFCERLVALSGDREAPPAAPPSRDAVGRERRPLLQEAKAEWVARFDVQYLTRLLERCQGNVAEAARRSGIDRVHLFRLIKKYGLRQS
jgi:two-component system, NtrC family, response regulator GlrR